MTSEQVGGADTEDFAVQVKPFAGYHQLYIAPRETYPEYDLEQPDALVQVMADRRSCIIITGIAMGPVILQIELVGRAQDAATGWEESAQGAMDLEEPLWASGPTVEDVVPRPVFTPPTPGVYRFRLSCRGRALEPDHVVFEPVETYLLQFWRD